jgi:hypothetical protein
MYTLKYELSNARPQYRWKKDLIGRYSNGKEDDTKKDYNK